MSMGLLGTYTALASVFVCISHSLPHSLQHNTHQEGSLSLSTPRMCWQLSWGDHRIYLRGRDIHHPCNILLSIYTLCNIDGYYIVQLYNYLLVIICIGLVFL